MHLHRLAVAVEPDQRPLRLALAGRPVGGPASARHMVHLVYYIAHYVVHYIGYYIGPDCARRIVHLGDQQHLEGGSM